MKDIITSYRSIILIALSIGVISGAGALFFFEGLSICTSFFMGGILGYQMPLEGESMVEIAAWAPPASIWILLPLITAGGLASGLIVWRFAPEAEGHGTDAAIKAFHREGRVRWRIPLVKAVASILTITTGGSAGREGPTAQISAGFGSIISDALGLSSRERRIAIATGIGAGIGTIFKAPLGGAILAAEILYLRDFESDAVIPAFLASIIGYSIFGSVEGYDPIFSTAGIEWEVGQIPFFLLLGAVCAAVGILYIRAFYDARSFFRSFFARNSLPEWLAPGVGAFFVGAFVIALAHLAPEAFIVGLGSLGTGYGFIQLALYGMLPLGVLILLPFARILTTSLTIGSGGSGGVFAPGLMVGGATGGAIGTALHIFVPSIVPAAAIPAFVIVGMIALFGSVAHAPIAVMIMVVEMTGDFSLLVPAMGAVAVAYVGVGERTIFAQQVDTRAHSPAHRGEYLVEILEDIPAASAMTPAESVVYVSPEDTCASVISLIDKTGHTGFPVIKDGCVCGIITVGDLRGHGEDAPLVVSDCMTEQVMLAAPQDSLEEVLIRMMDRSIHHIIVAEYGDPCRMTGFLTTTDIMRSYTRALASGTGEDDPQNS